MQTTPQERLALSVVALLLAAGAGVRYASTNAAPAGWAGESPESTAAIADLGERAKVEAARARRRSQRLADGERIDPNTADVDELQRLPRVGPALAARIIAHRETHGPFRTLADLDAVSGIGPALLDAATPHVSLPPAPPSTPPAVAVTAPAARVAPLPTVAAGAPLDLNRASAEELVRLPGVGPVLAGRIIEWRQANGPFRSVEELQKVPGIGPRSLERLAPLVRAGP